MSAPESTTDRVEPKVVGKHIAHLKGPGGAKVHSIRLSQQIPAIGYRDGDLLRLVSLHPDHDSAYER